MKDVIRHQLKFSVATTKNGDLVRAQDQAHMLRTQAHFREAHSDIKFWEIPLNQVTFLKIFSSYLDSIGVKCSVQEDGHSPRNAQLFELNLFCHFYYSIHTQFSEKQVKDVLFEMVDLDPRTIIKKTDIVVLARDELSASILDLHQFKRLGTENFFLVFIRRVQNEFEMKSIFKKLAAKHPRNVTSLQMHYLMPRFVMSKHCIGSSVDFRALGHWPALRDQGNGFQNGALEILFGAGVHPLRFQNQPERLF